MDEGSDGFQVEHESGLSRWGTRICCAVCGAPLLLLAGAYILGFNERNAVCQSRAFQAASDVVKEVGCEQTGSGALVKFSCDLKKDGLEFNRFNGYDALKGALPASFRYVGAGLRMTGEMLQCVEHEESHTEKDSVGGGTTTTKRYSYSMEWSSSPVDPAIFHALGSHSFRSNCGEHNQSWPAWLPQGSKTAWAEKVRVGNFAIEGELVTLFPLDKAVTDLDMGRKWRAAGPGAWAQGALLADGKPSIGSMRITLNGTDWSQPTYTVLGHEKGGNVSSWVAPPSFMCSGFAVEAIRQGVVSTAVLFEQLQAAADLMMYLLRLIGFILIWLGFAMVASPLGVVADSIPFLGPRLGDCVDGLACCAACAPATACALLVAGTMWAVMRPLIGVPMMLLGLAFMGGMVYARMTKAPKHAFQPLVPTD